MRGKQLTFVVGVCLVVAQTARVAADDSVTSRLRGQGLTQAQLDDQWDIWRASGPTHYQFRFQRVCFCAPDYVQPGLVKELGGQIASVTDPASGDVLDPSLFLTIDGLFDTLQSGLDAPADDFDKALGYPMNAWIDFIVLAADDEIGYTASDLVSMPEPTGVALFVSGIVFVARRRPW